MKFVDISGFGHSGKSSITDLLREFDGYSVPHHNFEFNLLRIQGGLIDLQHGLVDNWSPIRSDAAIRRFRKLIKRIGLSASIAKPSSLFLANGMNYDAYFQGKFIQLSEQYIESLIDYSYEAEWPYPLIDEPLWKQFYQRFALKLKLKERFETTIKVSTANNFATITQQYLQSLFSVMAEVNTHTMVLHNATEPFNPIPSLNLLGDAKIIVVQRDPRDIYASTFVRDGVYTPSYEIKEHWRIKSSFLATDNIDTFIERQQLMYKQVNKEADNNRVLRLKYEEVILDYNNSLYKIYNFLGETPNIHIRKKQYFDPDKSVKNIGMWQKMPNENIDKIEASLKEYCIET